MLRTLTFAAFCSWLLLLALIPTFRSHLLDRPNSRSSHQQPTPRGGGISFVFVAVVASGLALLRPGWGHLAASSAVALPLIALPLAVVGFIDDRHNLPASSRYVVQLATSLGLICISPLPFPWLALPLLLFVATSVINFTNFMDGLDGLVAGCMAIAITVAASLLMTPWTIWALVGALLGFLLWNWSPAKVFMGDVGSTFLGAVFAGLVLQASSWPEALALLLVATPLLGDASLCVIRRLMAGQPVLQAHRLHLFQRLYQAGWSHTSVASLYIAATAVVALALLQGGLPWAIVTSVLVLVVGIWLDQRVAVPFVLASRK